LIILLDTNVLSEAARRVPDASVMTWLDRVDPDGVRISVLTLGELAKGVAILTRRDPRAAEPLRAWVDQTRLDYADRLIDIDASVAEAWGILSAVRPLPVIDGLIAATARVHNLTLATRNVRDFADTGITLVNPWAG